MRSPSRSVSSGWSRTILTTPDRHSPGAEILPVNEETRRKLYTVGFAWREGADGDAKAWGAGGGGRRSVRWYFECLLETIEHGAREDARCRFLVHMHGALPDSTVEAFGAAMRAAFQRGRARGGGSQDAHGVKVRLCDPRRPPMWPQAARVAPLVDHRGDDIVVLVDIHDDRRARERAVDTLEETGTSLGLTFWKARGNLAASFASDPRVGPPPTLRPERSAAMHSNDEHWSVDAGLALSRPEFRNAVRDRLGAEAYDRFLDTEGWAYEYDATRGTDEKLLALFLLTSSDMVPLTRLAAVPFTHSLHGRSKDPPHWDGDAPDPPRYRRAADTSRRFAYDEEVPRRLAMRLLKWEARPRSPRRPRTSRR